MDQEPSRTQQMRTELGHFFGSQGRQLADMYVLIESKAWRRGFWAGFKSAAVVAALVGMIWYWWVN